MKEYDTITVDELSRLKNPEKYEVWDESKKQWVSIHGCKYLQPGRGFAPVTDPFMPITAITVHLQWLNALITVAVPPRGLPFEEAKEMCQSRWGDSCILFPNDRNGNGEREMLKLFLDLIQDADVISGWN